MSTLGKANELLRKRKELIKEARAIADRATRAGRDLTESEQLRFDAMMDQADGMEREARTIQEALEEREAEAERRLMENAADGDGTELRQEDPYMKVILRRGFSREIDEEVYEARRRGKEVNVLAALVRGPQNDLEERALSIGSNPAGGFTVDDETRAAIIDFARANSVALRAGARMVPIETGTVAFPYLASDPEWSYYAEGVASTGVEPTYGAWTPTAKTLRGIIKYSEELEQDSVAAGGLEGHLRGVIGRSMAQAWDQGVIVGASTAGGPTGLFELTSTTSPSLAIVNHRGSTTSTAAVGPINYSQVLAAWRAVARANHVRGTNADGLSWVGHPDTLEAHGRMRDGNENPMGVPPMLSGLGFYHTTAIPKNSTVVGDRDYLVGDFSKYLIAARLMPTVRVLEERYADEYRKGILAASRFDSLLEQNDAIARVRFVGPSTF